VGLEAEIAPGDMRLVSDSAEGDDAKRPSPRWQVVGVGPHDKLINK
jgi:hypothetical protein